jgi:hypothetical protein
MLIRLLTRLLRKQDWQQMEDHFSRQADAAEAEIAATAKGLKTATRNALSAIDPDIHDRYQAHLRRTGSPALAEMATIRDVQTQTLNRAFSVLDFGRTEHLNRERAKRR